MLTVSGLLIFCMAIVSWGHVPCPLHTPCLECIEVQNPETTCHFFVVVGKSRGYFCAAQEFEWNGVEGSMLFSRVQSNETCPILRTALNIPFQFPSSPLPDSIFPLNSTTESNVEVSSTGAQNATDFQTELEPEDEVSETLHSGISALFVFLCVMFLQGICCLLFARAVVKRRFRRFIPE